MRTHSLRIAPTFSWTRWTVGTVLVGLLTATACSESGVSNPPAPEVPLSVTVTPATLTLMSAGGSGRLTAQVVSVDGAAKSPAVTWSSDNTAIATVTGSGAEATITAVSAGVVTITATSGGVSGEATVEVSATALQSTDVGTAAGGVMTNGENHTGSITVAHQVDTWTFSAGVGNAILLGIGELSGAPDFTPWIRLVAPNGTVVGNSWGAAAAQISVTASQAGTYTVQVATADAGNDATGDYRLTLAKWPGTFVVPVGDDGGDMLNGVDHRGSTAVGDLDIWSFNAAKGNAIQVAVGEITGSADYTPWIRLIGPNGAVVGNSWGAAAAQISVTASLAGKYTVIVSTADAGLDGTGDYRVTLAKAPGAFTVSPGDQGGAMKNGGNHNGSIAVGDLDTWKFSASQGNAIMVSVGEVTGTADFTPWIRLVAPNGAVVGNSWGAAAAQISVTASVTGSYTVIVSTADAGLDAAGDYRVIMAKAPGAIVVPAGDQGGVMKNGGNHSGAIPVGDLDLWTIAATQGDYVTVSVGEVTGTPDFTPWIRLVAPNGAVVGNSWGAAATQISVAASLTGTYTVIVSTADAGLDATGNYRLVLAKGPGTFVVPAGDQGGAMTNGANHTGSIVVGDLDVWSFNATQGSSIALIITELTGTADYTPWIRLVGPNGALVGNTWGASSAQINVAAAPLTGTYTVIVSTADSGLDATGDYSLQVTGPGITVQASKVAATPLGEPTRPISGGSSTGSN